MKLGDQEKIIIVTYDENIDTYIRNALSPAEVVKVEIDKEAKRAKVFVTEDQSLSCNPLGESLERRERFSRIHWKRQWRSLCREAFGLARVFLKCPCPLGRRRKDRRPGGWVVAHADKKQC